MDIVGIVLRKTRINKNYVIGASERTWVHRATWNLWGITTGRPFIWASLLITVLFVWFEALYNVDLLTALSDPEASREAVDSLAQQGKLLASLGISWAIARTLISRVKPAILGIALFLLCATLLYFGLDLTYNRVIANLPPEVKLEGFNLFSYRRDLLTGRLYDPDIPMPKTHPVEGKILMGAFPIVLLDERFMFPARDVVQRKADDKSRAVLAKAAESWPQYVRQMNELDAGYRKYIESSRKAYQYRAFGGIERFRRESNGVEPNPNLSRIAFAQMLRNSNHPEGRKLREAESREIGKRPDGSIVHAGDVPYFMDRQGYMAWFNVQAQEAKAAALPTIETVDRFRGIQDINSAVFLPPMAMVTSLTSAVANLIGASLMLMSLALGATHLRGFMAAGRYIARFATPLMLVLFAGVLTAMPSHVFTPGTPVYELETRMHSEIGAFGLLWSKLSNVQALILR